MLGLAGVTAIDCSAAAVTVSTVEPVIAAERGADGRGPAPTRWPAPARGVVIVATEVVAEAQVTWLVRFWVELSE